MSTMANPNQQKVIYHRGGMRPNTPDRGEIRPLPAPTDKGGQVQSRNGDGTHRAQDSHPQRDR